MSQNFGKILNILVKFSPALKSVRHYGAVKLACETFGNTTQHPPLIIKHGIFGSKRNWRPVCKTLEVASNPKRKIIAVDARNHGESPYNPQNSYKDLAEDVAQVFKEQKIDKAIVLGHSMGGRAMMYFTLKHPQLVEKAIFVDISPKKPELNLDDIGRIFDAMRAVHISANLNLEDGRLEAKKIIKQFVNRSTIIDMVLRHIAKNEKGFHWTVNYDVLQKHFQQLIEFPHDELKSLQYPGPVLFIGATQTNFVSPAHLNEIQQFYPQAKIQMMKSGHNIHIENPASFSKAVLNFVNVVQK